MSPQPSPSDLIALLPAAAPGVMLQSGAFQRVAASLIEQFTHLSADPTVERIAGAAVIARETLSRAAYPERFPQLTAWVEPALPHEHAGVAMTPAACLPLYAQVAARGPVPSSGLLLAIHGPCHRTEEHYSTTRLRAFNMAELVFIGSDEQTRTFRADVLLATTAWLASMGLNSTETVANDPFWGRGSDVLVQNQRELETKIELSLGTSEGEVACVSANLHGRFFGERFDLQLGDGELAFSACIGVGVERLVLALIAVHGDRLKLWPSSLHDQLWGS